MTARPNLRVVPQEPQTPSRKLYDYESAQRRHILSRDWEAVHVRSDRSEPIDINERPKRLWR
jgi:hypothetical protein